MKDDMSSPFLSHWCDDDFEDKKFVPKKDDDIKCNVCNCKNSKKSGRVFQFGGLVLCAPCYSFLTTGKKCNSQLERNGGDIFKLKLKENKRVNFIC